MAEELHFGRAARRLNISAPPLTRRIKRLEVELGVLLFDRTKRTVALTVAGAVLLEEARQLMRRVNSLAPTLHRAERDQKGNLRVGVIGSAIFSRARLIQAEMTAHLPDVRVVWHELSSVAQIESIREQRLDLGLVNTPIEHAGVRLGQPFREPLVVVMSATHRLAGRSSIQLRSLKDELFIVGARHLSPGYYDRFISACATAGFSPNIEHQAGHMFTYISLVAIGAGVSLVPASMATAGLSGVAYVRIAGAPLFSEVSLAWNPANSSQALARVLRLLEIGSPRSGRTAQRHGARPARTER